MSGQKTVKTKDRYTFGRVDFFLIATVILLLAFGLIMLYSASSYNAQIKFGSASWYVKKQLVACVIGLAAMVVFMAIPYTFWKRIIYPFYFIAIISIFLVKTSLGVEAYGAARWIEIGFGSRAISIQPSEITKIAVILVTALFISKFQHYLGNLKAYLLALAFSGAGAVLVMLLTDDLGTGIIIFGMGLIMLFVAVPKKKYVVYTLVVLAAFAVVYVMIRPTKLVRVKAWLNVEAYASDESYQITQSLYAIGSGGFFGKGLGKSTQKMGFVPEGENDMIFSIICEELGIAGALIYLVLIAILLWRCVKIFKETEEVCGKIIVAGVASHIGLQTVINLMVVTSIIPNTGVPLPFISYGGTAIIMLLAELGLVLSVCRMAHREKIPERRKTQTEVLRFE